MKRRAWFSWLRVGQMLALAVLALLGVVDVTNGLFDVSRTGAEYPVLGIAEVVSGLAAATVWLTSHRLGPRALLVAAFLVSGWAFVVTMVPLIEDPIGGSAGAAETIALLGLLLVVTRRGARWWVLPVGAAMVVAIATQPLRGGGSEDRIVVSLILALVTVPLVAAGVYLRSLDNARLRQVAAVRAEQRAEFARDLHDFIAHHVTGIVVQAQGAKIVAADDPQRAISALEQIERAGLETMASMRRMVGVLRALDTEPDAPVAPLAGVSDLPTLVDGFTAAGPLPARLHVEGDIEQLPVEVGSSAYRVVMEALTNARQHAAGASTVSVAVHRAGDWVHVRIADDGRTVPRHDRRHQGFGLTGLDERIRTLGGRLRAGPGIDGGWVVDAAIPLAVPTRTPAVRIRA